jgi:hypothetical protein
MASLTESRLQAFLEHAQHSLYQHDVYLRTRDPAYREILEFVEELVDVTLELRRERAALSRIAGMCSECERSASDPVACADLARRMCMIARGTLGVDAAEAGLPATGTSLQA